MTEFDRSTPEGNAAWFANFIDENMAHNYIEAKIVRKVIRALAKAGNPVVAVDDREEIVPVTTEREILENVFNLDECWLKTASPRGRVRIMVGNEYDCIVDYTLSIEDALRPVNDWIDKHN